MSNSRSIILSGDTVPGKEIIREALVAAATQSIPEEEEAVVLCKAMMQGSDSVVIAGKIGVGKSIFLKKMRDSIPNDSKVHLFGELAEETVYPKNNIIMSELFLKSLRKSTDRIVIDELRDEAAVGLLTTAGDSTCVLTTIYAQNTDDVPYRLARMSQTKINVSERALVEAFTHVLDYVILLDMAIVNHEIVRSIGKAVRYVDGKPETIFTQKLVDGKKVFTKGTGFDGFRQSVLINNK